MHGVRTGDAAVVARVDQGVVDDPPWCRIAVITLVHRPNNDALTLALMSNDTPGRFCFGGSVERTAFSSAAARRTGRVSIERRLIGVGLDKEKCPDGQCASDWLVGGRDDLCKF